MSHHGMTESEVEAAALYYLDQLGYTILNGPTIAPGEPLAERDTYNDVVLTQRLRSALTRINPHIPPDAIDEALRQVIRSESQNLVENNRRFHKFLTDGVPVAYQDGDRTIHDQAWLIDFHQPSNNDWLAVNQFTIHENNHRRPDIILFLNGLPIAVLELKNAAAENADIDSAYNQLQTYKRDIPSLFTYNQGLVISDGLNAQVGTLTADRSRFMPWRNPPLAANTRADNLIPFPDRRQLIAADAGGISTKPSKPPSAPPLFRATSEPG